MGKFCKQWRDQKAFHGTTVARPGWVAAVNIMATLQRGGMVICKSEWPCVFVCVRVCVISLAIEEVGWLGVCSNRSFKVYQKKLLGFVYCNPAFTKKEYLQVFTAFW